MYEIAKNVIMRKDYELTEMIINLKSLKLSGDITDEQLTELMQLARDMADPAMSVNVIKRLDDIETRLRVIENKLAGSSPIAPSEEYPVFVKDKVYKKGDKVTFEGRKYICVLNEYTDSTTWSPGDYPAYWQECN